MDFVKTLLNIRSLRAVARDLTLEQLEEGLDKMQQVVAELRQGKEAEAQAIREREEKLAEYLEMMKADGINPDDLMGRPVAKKARTKRESRPAKYKYTNEDGQEKTWTGQGKKPKAIQVALDAGRSLDEFLIS